MISSRNDHLYKNGASPGIHFSTNFVQIMDEYDSSFTLIGKRAIWHNGNLLLTDLYCFFQSVSVHDETI